MRRIRSVTAIRLLLKLLNSVLWLFSLSFLKREVRRVILYRTARIGDFVVTIPAMVALRDRYPDAEILLVTTTSTAVSTVSADSVRRSLQGSATPPWFSFVVPSVVDRVHFLEGDRRTMIAEAREVIREFRPDAVAVMAINLENFVQRLRKILFFRLAGFRGPIVGWRMRQSLDFDPAVQEAAGMLEHNVASAGRSIYDLPGMPPFEEAALRFEMARSPEVIERVDGLWRIWNLTDRRVVALFPGATFAHKRWPVEHYSALAHAASAEPEVRVVVLGAESDRETTSALMAKLGENATDLTGRLNLLELTEFLSRVALYVGSDTGPMHLSTAVGTPTVGVMNHQELDPSWAPWGPRGVGIKHEVPCRGCYCRETCPMGTRACILDLPLAPVLDAVLPILRLPMAGEPRE